MINLAAQFASSPQNLVALYKCKYRCLVRARVRHSSECCYCWPKGSTIIITQLERWQKNLPLITIEKRWLTKRNSPENAAMRNHAAAVATDVGCKYVRIWGGDMFRNASTSQTIVRELYKNGGSNHEEVHGFMTGDCIYGQNFWIEWREEDGCCLWFAGYKYWMSRDQWCHLVCREGNFYNLNIWWSEAGGYGDWEGEGRNVKGIEGKLIIHMKNASIHSKHPMCEHTVGLKNKFFWYVSHLKVNYRGKWLHFILWCKT